MGQSLILKEEHCKLPGAMMCTTALVELTGSVDPIAGMLQQQLNTRL
jgi:hypothetical protein